MDLCCRPDHRIWQLNPMASTKTNGAFRDPFIDCDDIEAAQKTARRGFKIMIGANRGTSIHVMILTAFSV